jgi:hypothetical protein
VHLQLPACQPARRRGADIDPVLERVDRYLQLVKELDLRLVKVVDRVRAVNPAMASP